MFELTILDARPTALLVRRHYLRRGYRVRVETAAWGDAPYRTTLLCEGRGERILIECQGKLSYHGPLRNLREYLVEQRRPAELNIAVRASEDVSISPIALREIERDGVGLLLVDPNGAITPSSTPCNWAFFIAPDPNLRFGGNRRKVEECFHKYNRVNRLDGLRDLSNLVEGETRRLGELASRKGVFGTRPLRIDKIDWSDLINTLASQKATVGLTKPLIDDPLKNDLHSFRGGRNLADHPVRTHTEARRLANQFHDRMSLGARLVAELDSIRRSLATKR